jgi:hypothetical protein
MLFWGQIFEAKQGNYERSRWPSVASSIFNHVFYLLNLIAANKSFSRIYICANEKVLVVVTNPLLQVFCYGLFVETLTISHCLAWRMQVERDEDKEEDTNVAEIEGQAEGTGVAEGDDRRGASNGGFRRDGSQRMLRVVSCGNRFWVYLLMSYVCFCEVKMVLFGFRIIIPYESLPHGSFPRLMTRNW